MSNTRPLLADSVPHDAEPVDELALLREEIGDLRTELEALQEGLRQDRQRLVSLLHALRAIFSGDVEAVSSAVPVGGTNPRWEALKRAFPGRCAELVDTLIAHGPLNTSQIAAIMRADPRTVSQLIYKLTKAGGVEKVAGKFSLKGA